MREFVAVNVNTWKCLNLFGVGLFGLLSQKKEKRKEKESLNLDILIVNVSVMSWIDI